MGNKTLALSILCLLTCAAAVWLFVQNRGLRREIAAMRAERAEKEARRPQMKVPPRPPRPPRPLPPAAARLKEPGMPTAPAGAERPGSGEVLAEEKIDDAVRDRIAALRQKVEDRRARRREAIAALTPEEKEKQREAFVGKMRARAQQRLKAFVANTGLDEKQTAAFENTVSALDATLRETANAWADQIRKTGTFSRDAQVKFVGDISTVISAGYSEMDATLPATWRESEGNVNIMEIVGPEALSSMVEALTESGLEEGLQTIGQVMGRPDGEGGDAPEGFEGIESPGVGDGPGGMNNPGGANGAGGPGPGGPGM
jgi:hypothetical protein